VNKLAPNRLAKTNKMIVLSLVLLLGPLLLSGPMVFASHHSSNRSCNNSAGTCGNSSSDTAYENGLDAGTRQAQADAPNYGDYSPGDCVDSIGKNVPNPDAFCAGFVRGYYDTAGLPQLDQTGR
jgi:hypothetical protein